MANKKETPAEINKRIMKKFKQAPKGMGEVIGRYEPMKATAKKKGK